jgi:hypothetical protein
MAALAPAGCMHACALKNATAELSMCMSGLSSSVAATWVLVQRPSVTCRDLDRCAVKAPVLTSSLVISLCDQPAVSYDVIAAAAMLQDKNPDNRTAAETKFKDISEAYEVCSI